MYKRLGWAFRRRLMLSMGIEPFDERSYIQKALNPDAESGYDPTSLIGFWPQNEGAGLISYDHSGLGHHGAYTAVTLGQPGVLGMGMSAAGYDGATSYNNVWSAGLAAAFNGAEGTCLAYAQVANAGVWTDGALRTVFRLLADANNWIEVTKQLANNTIRARYRAGGTIEAVTRAAFSPVDYFVVAITWSASDDEVIVYFDGAQEGAIQTILGVWAGNLVNNQTMIGANDNGPASPWSGSIAPALLYTEALSQPAIEYLSAP